MPLPEMSPEQAAMFRQAEFGIRVEDFVSGAIGEYLIERSADERQQALADLVEQVGKDPTDTKALNRLYNIIERADSFHIWLEEAIQQGHQAHINLEQSEQPD